MVQTPAQILPKLLAEMKAPTTPAKPITYRRFVEWLRLETHGDPALESLAAACAEWAQAFRDGASPRWLSLLGNSGTGKTHCAKALWKWASLRVSFSRAEFQPHVIYWPDFIQRLRAGNGYELRNDLKGWPVLFLDDIGAERDKTGYAAEELNTLLGCRVDRWTLITANLPIERLAQIDERIASRLIRDRNIVAEVRAKDYATR